MEPYFGSNEIYSEEKDIKRQQQQQDITDDSKKEEKRFKYDLDFYDEYEDEHTSQLLLDADSEL